MGRILAPYLLNRITFDVRAAAVFALYKFQVLLAPAGIFDVCYRAHGQDVVAGNGSRGRRCAVLGWHYEHR